MPARAALIVFLFQHLFAAVALPQFLPSLQATDPAEFDDYLHVLQSRDPHIRLQAAARFEKRWPRSELLAHVFELNFHACRDLGDVGCALREGRRALHTAPSNVPVAFRLAELLAGQGDLQQASRLIASGEHALSGFRPPRTLPLNSWLATRRQLEARAASAKGLIAFKRGDAKAALALFEKAVRLQPEGADHLRLARLYKLSHRLDAAREQYNLAAKDPTLTKIVEAEAP